MPAIDSSNESGYSGSTHTFMRCLIREALEEQEEKGLGSPFDDTFMRVAIPLFEELHKPVKVNVCTPIFIVMEQAALNAFFNTKADELGNEKMEKLAEAQYFTNVFSATS